MLPKKYIESFMSLYEKRFGHSISYDEASKKASQLVSLMELMYLPKSENKPNQQRANKLYE